jgi:ubiquinone/menaquinone biosynthesis C-methylase UbiE/HEAT repeat protein
MRRKTVDQLSALIRDDHGLYQPLLLATSMQPRRWFDWNIGYLIPHLHADRIAETVQRDASSLLRSEGISWGLGELGSEDERIIDFLYLVCEECADYDAWWCAAQALEKLRAANHVDLLKRTLKGAQWSDLKECFQNLDSRAALIGILRKVTSDNLQRDIIPRLVASLQDPSPSRVQNAVWLLERLRFDDPHVLRNLTDLFQQAEDSGESLAPRIVEALGEIASADSRTLLEQQVGRADYFRTRAYAAKGLGLIGDPRSSHVLEEAFRHEQDPRVIPHITDALYAIRDIDHRQLNEVRRRSHWPENGMVVDDTNRWYANPTVYDIFSQAEDPENIAFAFAASLIPKKRETIVDLGAGTGRMSMYMARNRPDVAHIRAFDLNPRMVEFLLARVRELGEGERIHVAAAPNNALPLEDESVDVVVSSWAFPSRMWDVGVCLDELREVERVLKPRGILVTLGWDETFQDELSEFWYRYVPEPDFRRESLEEWRRRRRGRIRSPRNCHLTFVARNLRVPIKFSTVADAADVLGHLFGFAAGEWIIQTRRREFSMLVGVTRDSRTAVRRARSRLLEDESRLARS